MSDRIHTWQAMFPDRLDPIAFEILFHEELDSLFSADIACCSACHEAYIKTWPGIASSRGFQQSLIALSSFHERTRLRQVYSETEFLQLCRQIGCPVCGTSLEHNICAFNPHFDVPDELTTLIEELCSISTKTPFLALRHPLARRVLREVTKLAKSTASQPLHEHFYRARPITTTRESRQFLAPPAKLCNEGRYNHAGRPVLYLAGAEDVAYAEVGNPKGGCLVASVVLLRPHKILDLSTDEMPSDILQAITASALLSAPAEKEGWEKPEYTFSRFVADCAVDAGFTALRYPSVAHPDGCNLVVLPVENPWSGIAEIGCIKEFGSD